MGFLKIKQPVLESGRALAPAQTLTTASTGTTITPYGVTIISSTASGTKTFRLATPSRVGVTKEIIFRPTIGAAKIAVRANSTAQVFFGTTGSKTVTSATAQNTKAVPTLRLYARTSTSWVVLSKTTALTIA